MQKSLSGCARIVKTLCFLIVIVAGCIYRTEDEIYFDPIMPPDGSDAAVYLNEASEPIELYKPTTFEFQLSPTGRKEYKVDVLVDYYRVHTATLNWPNFVFSLDPANFPDGERQLSIIVTYLTGSKSIAGQLGAETITFQRDYVMLVDKVPPPPVAAPELYLEDGKSMVRWNPPEKYNFVDLIIRREYQGKQVNIKVPNKTTVVFHDAYYVGGEVSYQVVLSGHSFESISEKTEFEVTPVKIRLDSLATPYPVLQWERSPLYNNRIQILFFPYDGYFPEYQSIKEAGQIGIPAWFGGVNNCRIEIRPIQTEYDPSVHIYSFKKEVYKGIKIPPFNSMHYDPEQQHYLFLDNSALRKVDAASWIESTSVPASGHLLVPDDHSNYYFYSKETTQIVRFDPASLGEIESFKLWDIPGVPGSDLIACGKVTNDQLMACQFSNDMVMVIDLVNHSIRWSDTGTEMPVLSPDGNFLFWKGTLYERNNGSWDTISGTTDAWSEFAQVVFRQDSENQIFLKIVNELYVFELDALSGGGIMTPIKIVQTPFTSTEIAYQPENRAILINVYGDTQNELLIYDADTFSIIASIEGLNDLTHKLYRNGHFFHINGFYLP